MKRKIIFVDCDGTLFDVPRGMNKPSAKSKYAISELIKNGHLVFLASGRSKCLMNKDIVDLNPTGFITANGGYCYTKDTPIFRYDIKKESIQAVIDYCDSHDGVYYLENPEYIYTKDRTNQIHKDLANTWGIGESAFKDECGKDDTYQMMMTAFKDKKACLYFEEAMRNIVDTREQYGFTSFDVSEFGIDKGFGIRKVLEYYKMDKADAYGFGDGLNDFEMLEAVGESYAMENGNPKVKALAKNIAPDVLDDGFYQVMVWEGLIKPME